MADARKKRLEIIYCPGCRWLARAAWYAQELLETYCNDLGEVALIPSQKSGIFKIRFGDDMIMDRAIDGFLEAKIIKRRIRDHLEPGRHLGHTDK